MIAYSPSSRMPFSARSAASIESDGKKFLTHNPCSSPG